MIAFVSPPESNGPVGGYRRKGKGQKEPVTDGRGYEKETLTYPKNISLIFRVKNKTFLKLLGNY
jgi:hypothetical protein